MSLSSKLVGLLDDEIAAISAQVMGGGLAHEIYKHLTGKCAGLALAKELLAEVLESVKEENDGDI